MRHFQVSWSRAATATLLATTALMGCDATKSIPGVHSVDSSALPVTPMPMPGQASVSGVVLDGEGRPVVGATVKIPETDGAAVTNALGAYQLMVPADSTVTLVTTAVGFAPTSRESIVMADQAVITAFDVLMLSSETFTRMNAPGAVNPATPVGLMALRLHSTAGNCALAGAKVSVWPSKAANVVYSRPSATGGVDEPDATITSVQADVGIDAWLTGAILPGNMLQITVDQPGCTLMTQSPSLNGMQYSGTRRVDAQALTIADLFLN